MSKQDNNSDTEAMSKLCLPNALKELQGFLKSGKKLPASWYDDLEEEAEKEYQKNYRSPEEPPKKLATLKPIKLSDGELKNPREKARKARHENMFKDIRVGLYKSATLKACLAEVEATLQKFEGIKEKEAKLKEKIESNRTKSFGFLYNLLPRTQLARIWWNSSAKRREAQRIRALRTELICKESEINSGIETKIHIDLHLLLKWREEKVSPYETLERIEKLMLRDDKGSKEACEEAIKYCKTFCIGSLAWLYPEYYEEKRKEQEESKQGKAREKKKRRLTNSQEEYSQENIFRKEESVLDPSYKRGSLWDSELSEGEVNLDEYREEVTGETSRDRELDIYFKRRDEKEKPKESDKQKKPDTKSILKANSRHSPYSYKQTSGDRKPSTNRSNKKRRESTNGKDVNEGRRKTPGPKK